MEDLSRRSLMKASLAAAVGAGVVGVASAQEHSYRGYSPEDETDDDDTLTDGAPSVVGEIKRFSTTAFGAEMTGPFVFEDGSLLISIQHPSRDNPEPYDKAGVGYFEEFQFEFDGRNDDFAESPAPVEEQQDGVFATDSDFEYLIQEGDSIDGGEERWGITETPDGREITTDNFAGTTYGPSGYNMDCNQFVATNEDGTEGYLFTNDENSPGNVMRTPLSQTDDGEWEADPENAINTANTEPFREIGGTRINCYGDLSPWETMISSEENYAHPRANLDGTISDIVEAGDGEGLRAAAYFWNRPNPSEIQTAVGEYDEVDGWYVQGYWNMTGVEHLAYYLGADPVEAGDGNPIDPIGDEYPNPYRYGYHVDIREPTADPPQPVKYYVMGRAAWEAPDILPDERTAYGCSDGDSKGIYKFVADEPIPSYDDPMDVEGTLYAPKITNDEAASGTSPAEVDLEVEWIPLGSAANHEIESWIADYDDVTQVDYLESHTDWSEGDEVTEEVLKEADLEVIENGNEDYISDEEILEWARQWEERGPNGVDEELQRVPFLETRDAAKEIGASIEFNKAEGVDSIDGAEPGDFIYFGISELNDDMDDQEPADGGDIALDRVDGGVVYRAELEPGYDVSTLEPVVVGPDFTTEEAMADVDDSLRNIDNVYAMRDGRVLLCEDGWKGGNRSYPNDALYVYRPPTALHVDSVAVGNGKTGEAELRAPSLPNGLAGGRVTVSVAHTDVAEIVNAEYTGDLALTEAPSVAEDGSSVQFRFADIDQDVEPGALDVSLGSIELRGNGMGTTDLTLTVNGFDDDDGVEIEPQERPGVVITGPPAIGAPGGRPPTDPDGDGRFEDVNGNGRLDYDDIVLLFQEFDSDAVRMNEEAYDFNENGRLDFEDIVALSGEI